jgi:hypothetical protein
MREIDSQILIADVFGYEVGGVDVRYGGLTNVIRRKTRTTDRVLQLRLEWEKKKNEADDDPKQHPTVKLDWLRAFRGI